MRKANTYRTWEPPTRAVLPDTDPRTLRFERAEGNEPRVLLDNELLEQRIVYHSPDGFEFGYMGSGPSDLALNILAIVVGEREAFRLHQDFKFAKLGAIGFHGGVLAVADVVEWVRDRYKKELSDPRCIEQEKTMRDAWDYDAEQRDEYGLDPLEAPDTIDPVPPLPYVELAKPCDDASCKECRTGETTEANWYANVTALLGRPITDERELALATHYFTHGASEETAALALRDDPGVVVDV